LNEIETDLKVFRCEKLKNGFQLNILISSNTYISFYHYLAF